MGFYGQIINQITSAINSIKVRDKNGSETEAQITGNFTLQGDNIITPKVSADVITLEHKEKIESESDSLFTILCRNNEGYVVGQLKTDAYGHSIIIIPEGSTAFNIFTCEELNDGGISIKKRKDN